MKREKSNRSYALPASTCWKSKVTFRDSIKNTSLEQIVSCFTLVLQNATWARTISNSKTQSSDMICNNSVSHVHIVFIFTSNLPRILFCTCHLFSKMGNYTFLHPLSMDEGMSILLSRHIQCVCTHAKRQEEMHMYTVDKCINPLMCNTYTCINV